MVSRALLPLLYRWCSLALRWHPLLNRVGLPRSRGTSSAGVPRIRTAPGGVRDNRDPHRYPRRARIEPGQDVGLARARTLGSVGVAQRHFLASTRLSALPCFEPCQDFVVPNAAGPLPFPRTGHWADPRP